MKIQNLTIENFGCYKSKNIIKFNQDGKITLILGQSGSGKSTLFAFIKWMFYGIEPDFVKDKTLYNEEYYDQLSENSTFEVLGKIDFCHDNVDFELTRKVVFKKEKFKAKLLGSEHKLNYKFTNGSWITYPANIEEKIDEIIPKALSSFFFFSGEKNNIKEQEENFLLKPAIYNLFGISQYENALLHIGDKFVPNTLLYNYHKKKRDKSPSVKNIKADDAMDKAIIFLNNKNKAEEIYNRCCKKLERIENEIEELNIKIANAPNIDVENKNLSLYRNLIKSKEIDYNNKIKNIAKILYQNIPYLMLANQAKITKQILSKSAKEEKTYVSLSKETLLDIKRQNICVCGRCLDQKAIDHINSIIESMPPHSYNYIYNQFTRQLEIRTNNAELKYDELDKLLKESFTLRNEIDNCEEDSAKIYKKISEIKNSPTAGLAKRLAQLKIDRNNISSDKEKAYLSKEANDRNYKHYNHIYQELLSYEKETNEFDDRINILNAVKDKLNKFKQAKILTTIDELNEAMIEVNNQLSTRDQSFEENTFIDKDFKPLEAYFAGGQEVISYYSYIVGMIKALKSTHSKENEETDDFPLVIDAPFSHLDNNQVSNVVNVFPKIANQIIMLSINNGRIKEKDKKNIGYVYEIKSNNTQTVSTIREKEE